VRFPGLITPPSEAESFQQVSPLLRGAASQAAVSALLPTRFRGLRRQRPEEPGRSTEECVRHIASGGFQPQPESTGF
jgi:hypothetical protein